MFGGHFYHGTIRKAVITFGTLFNDMTVNKYDANGDIIQTIPIPLSYGPREKFLSRINASTNPLTLPRMSFEMVSLDYDPERRLGKTDTITKEITEGGSVLKKVFNPVPYNLTFDLQIMVKNSDDGIQLVEQILPWFAPTFGVTIDILPEMEIMKDIDIVMTSITTEDTYEGDYDTRRVLTWTLSFVLKTYLYGPVRQQGVITTAVTDYHAELNNDIVTTRQIIDQNDYNKDDNFGFGDAITDFPNGEANV